MAKQIRHVKDLPEWFDLEKYAGASKLDLAGWYEQLSIRRDLLRIFPGPDGTRAREITNGLEHSLKIMRAEPIVDVAADLTMKCYFLGGALYELKTGDPQYSLGVHPITVRNLYTTEWDIDSDRRTYARNFFGQFLCESGELGWTDGVKYPHVDWIDQPVDAITISGNYRASLSVDMLLPDKVLIEQFKRTLAEMRHSNEMVRGFSTQLRKPDVSSWVRFGVLPFLDLTIWAHEAGTKIPNRVMADAIFSVGEGGEEAVRKTTESLINDLMSHRFQVTLAALAAHEIAERNTAETLPEE